MSFHNTLTIPPYVVAPDYENMISLLALLGLSTFFYFAFDRLYQPGGGKHMHGKLFYTDAGAA